MSDLIDFIEEEIGAMLRSGREDLGITREEMAARLDTTVEEIEKIEHRRGKVSLALLQRFADAVGKKIKLKFL